MKKKYYIDTCIWRDYYENRFNHIKSLGILAMIFFRNLIKNRRVILYSDIVIDELKNAYGLEDINNIFRVFQKRDLLRKVPITKAQLKEAVEIYKSRDVPLGDAIHAILARDNNAILITRDRDFLRLADIVESKKPEDLI